jgi:N-acetyl-anhydromuramyl-L-alanine amidase AmpD
MIDAEYPRAICVQADPANYREGPRPMYERIVIHCTDGHGRAQGTAEMWQKPGPDSKHTSAHFVVGQDGLVIQCVSLLDIAWHAHHASLNSVGIEHCARTPREWGAQDPGLRPSSAQINSSAKLVAWLLRRAKLPATRAVVLGHHEADPQTTHTKCPEGCGWDWEMYMRIVEQELAAYDKVA